MYLSNHKCYEYGHHKIRLTVDAQDVPVKLQQLVTSQASAHFTLNDLQFPLRCKVF
jgi:hypothetical protein